MGLSNSTKLKGLYTYGNELIPPEGSLVIADNVNIDEPNIITPRRGFEDIGQDLDSNVRISQLLSYKKHPLIHIEDRVEYYSNSDDEFLSFYGSYNQVDSDIRIKSIEANGNLYFTTDSGIKKISAKTVSDFSQSEGYVVDAGTPKALDCSAIVKYTASGYLPPESKVAYKVLFGRKDVNNNLILGTPSARFVAINASSDEDNNANADVIFTIPFGVDNTFFYRIYRTAFVTVTDDLTINDIDPGEFAYLVYEAPVTTSEGSKVTVEDITPDTFRASGVPLYNNPGLGSDILQTNDQPPIAKDICNYQTFTFYANTKLFHRMNLDLIGMDSFVSESSQLVVSNIDTTSIYTFRGSPVSTDITCGTKANTKIHKPANVNSKVLIYSASDETKYVLYFDDGTSTVPSDTNCIFIKVDIADLVAGDNVAPRMITALGQFSDFIITNVTGSSFTITNSENGTCTSIDTGNSNPVADLGTGWVINETSAGSGEDAVNNIVLLSGSPSAALRIEKTTRSLVNVINSNIDSTINAYYLSGLNDLPGKMLLESRSIVDDEFYVAVKDIDSNTFNPSLPEIPSNSFTDIEADGLTKTVLELVGHSFEDGEEVFIYLPNSVPEIIGIFNVEVVDVDHISIDTFYSSGDTTDSFYFYPFQVSDNLAIPNRLYWSKSGQPEAVPSVNYIDIGVRDEPIERILSLRDYLFILKSDGIYMLSGYTAPFTVRQLDTETIVCPDSAVVLNNQIYMLSENSVIVINESSPSIISRMIEDKLSEVLQEDISYRDIGFGVAYDNDRAYMLWLPSNELDTVSTQCFRYNILERTWTRWTKTATCGLTIGTQPKLYIGDGDRATVMIERKKRDRTDHADKDFEINISPLDSFINGRYRVSDTTEIEVGDVVVQTQYVNIDEYNRLLDKLDLDPGLVSTDYNELACETGDNIASKLTSLNMKLIVDDTSGTVTSHVFNNNDWIVLQETYNELIVELNDTNCLTQFKDYKESEGTIEFEYIISEVNMSNNEIKLAQESALILGNITIYKQIKSVVQTNPIHFGNPSSWKQIPFGYLMFDQNNFYKMKLEYSTDLSASFEGSEFNGRGAGFWGYGEWGMQNRNYWGGDGNDAPRRTIIPRNKQRCRYISVRFSHNTARDFYKVDGVGHEVREFSNKAYK
jgi:hypothetical protein